jgi:hypothetical protein
VDDPERVALLCESESGSSVTGDELGAFSLHDAEESELGDPTRRFGFLDRVDGELEVCRCPPDP